MNDSWIPFIEFALTVQNRISQTSFCGYAWHFEIGIAAKDLSSANSKNPRYHMEGVTWAFLAASHEAVIQEQGVHLGDIRSRGLGRGHKDGETIMKLPAIALGKCLPPAELWKVM